MEQAHILILAASIGAGHMRAAEAIRAALAEHPNAAGMKIDVVDFMAREVSSIHYLMKRIYLTMLRFVPDLYDVFFRIAGKKSSGGLVRSAFAQVMVRTMGRLVRSYQPDLIVATHPFPEGAAALWRARNGGSFLLAALLTDYALHEIWLAGRVDTYFVATDAMAQQMVELGFDSRKVHATGIPIIPPNCSLGQHEARGRADGCRSDDGQQCVPGDPGHQFHGGRRGLCRTRRCGPIARARCGLVGGVLAHRACGGHGALCAALCRESACARLQRRADDPPRPGSWTRRLRQGENNALHDCSLLTDGNLIGGTREGRVRETEETRTTDVPHTPSLRTSSPGKRAKTTVMGRTRKTTGTIWAISRLPPSSMRS